MFLPIVFKHSSYSIISPTFDSGFAYLVVWSVIEALFLIKEVLYLFECFLVLGFLSVEFPLESFGNVLFGSFF